VRPSSSCSKSARWSCATRYSARLPLIKGSRAITVALFTPGATRPAHAAVSTHAATFLGAMRIVPWHRLNRFQLESLRLIAEATLSHTPHYRKKGRSPRLYFPERSDPADYEFHFPTPAVLHASQHNPGAAHVAELLAARVDNLDCPQQSRPLLETFERLRKESHSSGSSVSLQRLPIARAQPSHSRGVGKVSRALASVVMRVGVQRTRLGRHRSKVAPSWPAAWSNAKRGRSRHPRKPSGPSRPQLVPQLSRMHSFRSASRARQFLLLYLNADTFVGEAGDALEMEVHAAISAGVEVCARFISPLSM